VPTLRQITVSAATAVLCMLLGAAVYESVVMAPNYAHGIASLEHARGFLVVSTPAKFFRFLSPAAQVLLVLSAILSWRLSPRRVKWMLLIALGAAVTTDVVTFTFHYPRNEILFLAPLDRPSTELQRIAQEWAWGNYLRILLLTTSVVAAFAALWELAKSLSPNKRLERARER
jgi:hypothetical protein